MIDFKDSKFSKTDHKILNLCKKKNNLLKVKITSNKLEHFSKTNTKNKMTQKWFIIDMSNVYVGRVASFVSNLIRGKLRPEYTPNANPEVYVILTNCSKILMSGNKMSDKIYRHHTGYRGGLKEHLFPFVMQKDPTRVVRRTILGMIPKGPLFNSIFRNIKFYEGETHPHDAQNPEKIDICSNRKNVCKI